MGFPCTGCRSFLAAAGLAAAGCAAIPFQTPTYVPLQGQTPTDVRAGWERLVPRRYQLDHAVVFRFRGRDLAAVGAVDVDQDRDTFAVACLSHTGVKLFEVAGQGEDIRSNFALPMFTERGDYARAVGADIRQAYFGLVPPTNAAVSVRSDRMIFAEERAGGRVEYEFGGPDLLLVEKRCYEDGALVYRVGYYEYRRQGGKAWPGGIYLRNRRYGYSLAVRLTRIHPP